MKFIACLIAVLVMNLNLGNAENLLKSASFAKESGWDLWVTKPASAAGFSASFADGKVVVKNATLEKADPFNVQLKKIIELDASKKYKLKFKANTEKEGKITIMFGLMRQPYTRYASVTAILLPGEKIYEYNLSPKKDANGNYESPQGFNFALGDVQDSTIILSEISLEEVL